MNRAVLEKAVAMVVNGEVRMVVDKMSLRNIPKAFQEAVEEQPDKGENCA